MKVYVLIELEEEEVLVEDNDGQLHSEVFEHRYVRGVFATKNDAQFEGRWNYSGSYDVEEHNL